MALRDRRPVHPVLRLGADHHARRPVRLHDGGRCDRHLPNARYPNAPQFVARRSALLLASCPLPLHFHPFDFLLTAAKPRSIFH